MHAQRLEIKTHNIIAPQSVLVITGNTVKASENTLCLNDARAIDMPDEVATVLGNAGTCPAINIALLTFVLMPFMVLFANVGRGYPPAIG